MAGAAGDTANGAFVSPDCDAQDSAQSDVQDSAWGNASEWAVPELQKAEGFGIIPETLRDADLTQPITRAEFAAVSVKVYEYFGPGIGIHDASSASTPEDPAQALNPFTDTSDPEVLKAYNIGITAGTSDSTFEPDLFLNREEAAVMLARAYKRSAFVGWTLAADADFPFPYTHHANQAPFDDDAYISDWARDSVYFMASKGIILGMGDNLFGPRNTTPAEEEANYANATREQALLIAARMIENLEGLPLQGHLHMLG